MCIPAHRRPTKKRRVNAEPEVGEACSDGMSTDISIHSEESLSGECADAVEEAPSTPPGSAVAELAAPASVACASEAAGIASPPSPAHEPPIAAGPQARQLGRGFLWGKFRFTPKYNREGAVSDWQVRCHLHDNPLQASSCTRSRKISLDESEEETIHRLKAWALSGYGEDSRLSHQNLARNVPVAALPSLEECERVLADAEPSME